MHKETLKDIGEKELIKRLAKFMPKNQISDDCALVKPRNNNLLINNDVLVENIHFSKETISALDLGWKAVVSNLSDLVCSGSRQTLGITVGLILPSKTEWSWIEELYIGINEALKEYGGVIIGGDCSLGSEKVVSITAIGIQGELKLRRDACKPDEIILTSGIHGLSKLGLMLKSKKDFKRSTYLSEELIKKSIKHFCRPKLKHNFLKDLLKSRSNKKIKRIGCTDSSDGLFQAIYDLSIASNCKAIINYEKIPKDKDWPTGSQWDNFYFFGGEDYQLVFSLPKNWAEKLLNLDNNFREIGYFTCGEASVEFNNSKYNGLLNSEPYKHF